MQLVMNGRRIELTNRLQEYVAKKVSKLERHVPELGQVRAELAQHDTYAMLERYTCQLTTWFDHRLLSVEVAADDMKVAVNGAVVKLERQLRKQKVQHQHKGRPSVAMTVEKLSAR
ncbi:MAG: ribosome-associated translation inhibitor RaiA [Caldilineaceae bacterium]|nr:ribosome-associated translation inhibitor RaiA [Caldilineaceae bacterium]